MLVIIFFETMIIFN